VALEIKEFDQSPGRKVDPLFVLSSAYNIRKQNLDKIVKYKRVPMSLSLKILHSSD
jgi:hypothetical protein